MIYVPKFYPVPHSNMIWQRTHVSHKNNKFKISNGKWATNHYKDQHLLYFLFVYVWRKTNMEPSKCLGVFSHTMTIVLFFFLQIGIYKSQPNTLCVNMRAWHVSIFISRLHRDDFIIYRTHIVVYLSRA